MVRFFAILILILFIACEKNDVGNNDGDNSENSFPEANSYITPPNNQTCTGNLISPIQIQVNFEWEDFYDAEDDYLTYTFSIINQASSTEVVNETLTATNISVILDKGVTYSWNVVGTDSDGASTSGPFWQFQTPFDSVSNYAPFPATLLSPINGESLSSAVLSWEGNDPDPGETDQLKYDVYLGTTNPPILVSANTTEQSHSQALTPGIYFWKIVSKDPNGNSSISQIRQFEIE